MIRLYLLLFMVTLSTIGCIPRTQTDVPEFSGTVVDSNSRQLLSGVQITEYVSPATENGVAKTVVTGTNGRFDYPAITSGIVFQMPVPGAGWVVSRTLTFHKDGYRDVTCAVGDMSLFGKPHEGTISLAPGDHTQIPVTGLPIMEGDIVCDVFVGDQVIYKNELHRIEDIYQQTIDGFPTTLFSLKPSPPNAGEVVMDVEGLYLRLAFTDQQKTKKINGDCL